MKFSISSSLLSLPPPSVWLPSSFNHHHYPQNRGNFLVWIWSCHITALRKDCLQDKGLSGVACEGYYALLSSLAINLSVSPFTHLSSRGIELLQEIVSAHISSSSAFHKCHFLCLYGPSSISLPAQPLTYSDSVKLALRRFPSCASHQSRCSENTLCPL